MTEHGKLKHAPLVLVAAQVNYPPVEDIETHIPAIQTRIKEQGYPYFDDNQPLQEITVTQGEGVRVNDTKQWCFINKKKTISIALTKNMLAVNTVDDMTFRTFLPEIENVITIIADELSLEKYNTPEPLPSPYTPDELKDILTKIQAAFGVSTRDLADILRVQRQTIYAWNREENVPNEQNIARLQELDRKADDWNKLSSYPAKSAIKVKLSGGKSLLDLLTDELIDHNKITKAMSDVAGLVNDYFERLNQRGAGMSKSQSKPLPVSEYDLLALESVALPE